MSPDHLFSWTSSLGGLLLRASLGGALCAVLAWVVCRAFHRLPARVRCLLWWGVCLRFLVGLTGWVPLGLPILPSLGGAPAPQVATIHQGLPRAAATLQSGVGQVPALRVFKLPIVARHQAFPVVAAEIGARSGWPPSRRASGPTALAALGTLWLIGLAVQLVRLTGQWVEIRRLVGVSRRLTDPAVLDLVSAQASAIGLKEAPVVLCSPAAVSPQTVGTRRPVVILPADPHAFSRPELIMAIGHELAHVRRHDLLWGWIAAGASRLFFFHPAALLAAREYGLAREAACDAEVLGRLDLSPRAYGSFLLKLTTGTAPCGIAALSAAPPVKTLKRRIAMLHDSSKPLSGKRRFAPVLAVAALLPIDFVARPLAQVAEVSPVPTVAEQHAVEGLENRILALQALAIEPARPVVQGAAARKPASGPRPLMAVAREIERSGEPVVFIHDGQTMVNGPGGVDIEDAKTAGSFSKSAGGGDLLWFRFHGKDYYTRDAATIQQVSDIYSPIEELGRKQGEIGSRQGALGSEQGKLGAQEGTLGAQQAELEGKLAALEGKIAAREGELAAQPVNGNGHESDAQLEKLKEESKKMRKEIRDRAQIQRDRSHDLAEQQHELGEQQRELGHQQSELGRQQKLAAEAAQVKIHALIEKIVAAGLAQPMP